MKTRLAFLVLVLAALACSTPATLQPDAGAGGFANVVTATYPHSPPVVLPPHAPSVRNALLGKLPAPPPRVGKFSYTPPAGTANLFVYKPGAVASPGIYTTFDAAYTAAINSGVGVPIISVDGSLGTPVVLATGAHNPYTLDGFVITTPNYGVLTWNDGAHFVVNFVLTLDGGITFQTAATTTPTYTTVVGQFPTVLVRGTSFVQNTSAATQPFFHVPAGAQFFMYVTEGSFVTPNGGAGTIVDVAATGSAAFVFDSYCTLGANALSGAGHFTVAWPNGGDASISGTQSASVLAWTSGPITTASFNAAATLTGSTAAQNIPPSGTTTVLQSSDNLGHLLSGQGVTTQVYGQFTGSASNVGGQTAAVACYRNGVAITGASVSGVATTAGVHTFNATFTPVLYAPGDYFNCRLTTGSLTAALTDLMVTLGNPN